MITDPELADCLQNLMAARAATRAKVANLPQEQFDRAPGRDEWSAGEVLDHLVLVESKIRQQLEILILLQKAGDRAEVHWTLEGNNVAPKWMPPSMMEALETPFTLFSTLLPKPIFEYLVRNPLLAFRPADFALPVRGRNRDALLAELQDSGEATKALVEQNGTRDFAAMILRHATLGSRNGRDLIRFLWDHEVRHNIQLDRLLATRPGH